MKLQGINEYILEAKGKWKHSAVGKQGVISKYVDGSNSVKFEFDSDMQKWYCTSNTGKTRTVPSEYEAAFGAGNIKLMTKFAKEFLK